MFGQTAGSVVTEQPTSCFMDTAGVVRGAGGGWAMDDAGAAAGGCGLEDEGKELKDVKEDGGAMDDEASSDALE